MSLLHAPMQASAQLRRINANTWAGMAMSYVVALFRHAFGRSSRPFLQTMWKRREPPTPFASVSVG
jgi:hypothetical protein